jgi:hypothetical protein
MSFCHGPSLRHRGIGLIAIGALILCTGLLHRYRRPCHSEGVERHIAEVCLRAAEGVRR